MKALELLREDRDYCLSINNDKSIIQKYDEAIKELEAYITNYQEIKGKAVEYLDFKNVDLYPGLRKYK